ncbi:hypothetical protein THAOC_26518, partial [Thalassiosira oceanica]
MKNQARNIAQHQSTTGDSDSPDDSAAVQEESNRICEPFRKETSSLRVTLAALENMLPSPHREIVPGEHSMPRNDLRDELRLNGRANCPSLRHPAASDVLDLVQVDRRAYERVIP